MKAHLVAVSVVFSVVSAGAPAPLSAQDLLGHWPFDGDLLDAEGVHDGVFFGGPEPVFGPGYDGTEDGAVVFDGVNDYVQIADPDTELAISDQFTLALWFKPASTDQSQKYLLSRNAPGAQYAIIYEYTDDRVDFFAPSRLFGDDPRAGGLSEMEIADTEWHHIAYTYDGVVWAGYLDGELLVEAELSFALDNLFQSSWWVGAANPNVNYVAGLIDDVRIYSVALDEDEIAELYQEPVEVECPAEGDTRCDGLEVEGPAGGVAGDYTVTASASDDSGDSLLYTFTAESEAGTVVRAGPQSDASATLSLSAGSWTISVHVDDDALCDDELAEAVCSTEVVVAAPPPTLVAHWAFDADLTDSAGDNDGIFFGDVEPFFVEGYDGLDEGAISLDGFDDYVQIVEAPELRLSDRFTLSLWFQSASVDQVQKYLFSRNDSIPGGSGKQYAIIYEYTDDRVDFYAPSRLSGADPRAGGQSEMPITDTDWHHIAYTYDGVTWAGYIDGVQVFSTEISFVLDDTFSSSWWIGAANPNVNYTEGAIDDVRIYNYGLSAQEIAELVGEVAPCPDDGDTHVTGLEVDGPDGEPGQYEVTATASDDSGDAILYTFRATRGGAPLVVGPQEDNVAIFDLSAGDWEISVTVDDDPLCPDAAADASQSVQLSLGAAPDLVGHWELDGDLADSAGVNDGVFFGDVEPFFVDGYDGTPEGAILFDGVDDFVEIVDDPVLRLYDRFTLALWFRAESTDQSQKYLLSHNGSGAQYAIIYEYTDDRLDFFAPSRAFGDDPRAGGLSEMPLADTEWHHIAYAYDGATWSGYLDGEEVFARPIVFALNDEFLASWWIGAANPNANHVAGAIDDVRIYSYGLDAAEIAELAGTGTGGVGPFLRGDCNDDGGVNISDATCALGRLFGGDAPANCAAVNDINGDAAFNISDAVALLNYLFAGGLAPPPPFEDCGPSERPSDATLGCEVAPESCQ